MQQLKFENKLMHDYLKTGKYHKVLLQFYHGLGDAISFYANVLPVLKVNYPDVDFYVDYHRGQCDLFGYVDRDESHYDITFLIGFPCAEWDADTDETKAEKCIRMEIGGQVAYRQPDVYEMPKKFSNPLVGVHFFSTSNEKVSCSELAAKIVWDRIMSKGLIPIDTHMSSPDPRVHECPYKWEYRNVYGCKNSISTLFGLIGSLGGFAGVSGGNFWTALCCLPPEKILYIETEFHATKLTRLPVHHWKYGEPKEAIDRWLDCVAEK